MKYNIIDQELQGACPVQIQPISNPIMSSPELWNRLDKAKTKQEKLEACYEWISGHGGFGNCPKEKLAKIRNLLT